MKVHWNCGLNECKQDLRVCQNHDDDVDEGLIMMMVNIKCDWSIADNSLNRCKVHTSFQDGEEGKRRSVMWPVLS